MHFIFTGFGELSNRRNYIVFNEWQFGTFDGKLGGIIRKSSESELSGVRKVCSVIKSTFASQQ